MSYFLSVLSIILLWYLLWDKSLFLGGHTIKIIFIVLSIVVWIYMLWLVLQPVQWDAMWKGMESWFRALFMVLVFLVLWVGWFIYYYYTKDTFKIHLLWWWMWVLIIFTTVFISGIDKNIYTGYKKITTSIFLNKYPIYEVDINSKASVPNYFNENVEVRVQMENNLYKDFFFSFYSDIKPEYSITKYENQLLLKQLNLKYTDPYSFGYYIDINLDIDKQKEIFKKLWENNQDIKAKLTINIEKDHNITIWITSEDNFYELFSGKSHMNKRDIEEYESLSDEELKEFLRD